MGPSENNLKHKEKKCETRRHGDALKRRQV
jgi:hypothetical protein